ncbi:MAG TPA: gliding motility-associated C-terminal domain-containing protein, partial [Pedobacter sp.]
IQTLNANNALVSTSGVTWYLTLTGGTPISPTWNQTGSITYYAEYFNGTCSSLTRTPVTLTIDAAPPAPALSGSGSITQCEINPIQTLNANNALVSSSGVTWFSTLTGGSPIASPTLAAIGTVTYYAQYTNGTCSSLTRTPVTLTINAAPAAPTLAGNVTVCENGSSQTLTATAVVPSGYSIVWYNTSTGGSVVPPSITNTTPTAAIFYAEAVNNTTGCTSLARTSVTLTINPAPAAPALAGNGIIQQCEASPIQTLNANNALVSTSGVTWYLTLTGGTPISPTWNQTGSITYYAEYFNGTCSSLTRTPVTLTIDAAPPAPALSGSGTITQCEANPIQTLNANNALVSTSGITWYSSSSGGSVIATPTLAATGTVTYYAQYTNGTCSSLTRTPVTLTINPAPAAPALAGNGIIQQCEASLIQTLNANNALVSTLGVTWYLTLTGGTPITPTWNQTGSITYYAEYFNGTCSSLTRTPVTLTIDAAPPAPALSDSGTVTQCEANPIQTLNANNALVSTSGITWYSSSSGGSVIATPTLTGVGTVVYYAEYFNGTCSSLTRTAVVLNITPAPPAPVVSSNNIAQCQSTPIQTLDARATLISSAGIKWYTTASGGASMTTPPIWNTAGSVTYYAEAQNTAGCVSLTRTPVTLTIKPLPKITQVTIPPVCTGTLVNRIDFISTVPGTTYSWTATSTSPIGLLTSNGTDYIPSFTSTNTANQNVTATIKVTPTANGCTGPVMIFTITILRPITTTLPSTQEICSGQSSTAISLSSNQTTATFSWNVINVTGGISGYIQNGVGNSIPSQTFSVAGNNSGTITYEIFATTGGCTGPASIATITVIPLPTQAETYGNPSKRYSVSSSPLLEGNTALVGTGRWFQTSGPNTVTINNPLIPQTTISGHMPGNYEFKWTITNHICVSERTLMMAVNAPPVAVNDNFGTRVNYPLNANVGSNDSDPDGTVLTFTQLTNPAKGILTFNSNGTFNYIPETGFVGAVTFNYSVCDVDGECRTAVATINFYNPTIVNLTPAKSKIFEGGSIAITAELLAPIHEDVTITLRYSGDAVLNSDFKLYRDITLTIKAGETKTTQRHIIGGVKDDIKENEELAIIDVDGISSFYVDAGTGSEVTIQDVFPTDEPPSGANENADIRPDPMFSPNEDGLGNEVFFIYNISAYPDNEVVIFNRWGNEVFREKNYNNEDHAFRGRANRGLLTNTKEDLVDGVYFYLIHTKNAAGEKKLNKGYTVLKRKR